MKAKYFASVVIALTMVLAGCSQPQTDTLAETPAAEATTKEATPTSSSQNTSETIEGKVGVLHGMDCENEDDCSVHFEVEELTQLDECDAFLMEEQPEETYLVKTTVRVITKESTQEYFNPGSFPATADWSALTSDGVNTALRSSASCYDTDAQPWGNPMKTGDTEIRTHYMDVPEDATALRLTEISSDTRWEFDLATELDKTSTSNGAPSAPEPTQNAVVEQPAMPAAPAQETLVQESPVQAVPVEQTPATPPVRGFTGAPSVSEITELDKTISHCGDPSIHQTGTTFFTDGTSGWTENCSAQMLG